MSDATAKLDALKRDNQELAKAMDVAESGPQRAKRI